MANIDLSLFVGKVDVLSSLTANEWNNALGIIQEGVNSKLTSITLSTGLSGSRVNDVLTLGVSTSINVILHYREGGAYNYSLTLYPLRIGTGIDLIPEYSATEGTISKLLLKLDTSVVPVFSVDDEDDSKLRMTFKGHTYIAYKEVD